jgi:Uma2 family endonuclease
LLPFTPGSARIALFLCEWKFRFSEMVSALEKASVREAAVPITVEQYHRLGAAGIIAENTELLFGVIVAKMSKSPFHTWVLEKLVELLRGLIAEEDHFHVRQEQPMTLRDSEPEPDIAIVAGTRDAFKEKHPDSAELVIEVAISSSDIDREKAAAYAGAGVPEYWIIEPERGLVTLFSKPSAGKYQEKEEVQETDAAVSRRFPKFSFTLVEFIG